MLGPNRLPELVVFLPMVVLLLLAFLRRGIVLSLSKCSKSDNMVSILLFEISDLYSSLQPIKKVNCYIIVSLNTILNPSTALLHSFFLQTKVKFSPSNSTL